MIFILQAAELPLKYVDADSKEQIDTITFPLQKLSSLFPSQTRPLGKHITEKPQKLTVCNPSIIFHVKLSERK